MQELIPQIKTDTFVIASIVINNLIIGWTVTDRQLERTTNKTFDTAGLAFEWAEKNYKGIDDEG